MGRPRKKPLWVIVLADDLGCIDENKVLDLESELEKSFLDDLSCPAADEVLIALRKSFSMTYPRNPFVDGLQQALSEIRRIGIEALKEIPEVLEELRLPSIPATMADASAHRAILFKYSLVRSADLAIKVQYEGKSRSLLKLLEPVAADPLIRTLREVVSDTFSEMHSEEQPEEALKRIRDRIWDVLPPFNSFLDDIEIEHIAERPRMEDTAASSEEHDSDADDQAVTGTDDQAAGESGGL
jgi:hypothetical protein